MITNFKIFENNNELQVGDYVLIHSNAAGPIKDFINNNIGQINWIFTNRRDKWNRLIEGDIQVKYTNIPRWHIHYFCGDNQDLRNFTKAQVVEFGKTKEEVERKITQNKYNL